MENASKALIIAGAILLSILIISLGIMVYNNSKNTVGNANLSQQEIATFNSQWESYCGGNKSASEVSTMISAVIASNAAEKNTGAGRIITVTAADTDPALNNQEPTTVPIVPATNTYKITADYKEGLIVKLTVAKNTTTTP